MCLEHRLSASRIVVLASQQRASSLQRGFLIRQWMLVAHWNTLTPDSSGLQVFVARVDAKQVMRDESSADPDALGAAPFPGLPY